MGPTRGCGNGCRFLLASVLFAGAADFAAAQQGSPPGPGPNYSHPKGIIFFLAFAAAVVLVVFALCIKRRAGGPLGGPGEHPGAGRPSGGLDPAVLEAFPTMTYADVKAHKAGKGTLGCAFCLGDFDDEETLRLLPKCSHAFHPVCIDRWLASHVTCPVCRANLVPDAEAPTAVSTAESTTIAPAQEASAAPDQVTVVVVDAEETEEERGPPPEARWRVLLTALFFRMVKLFTTVPSIQLRRLFCTAIGYALGYTES